MNGRKENRGFSLVEIICAVAIFSLVTVTIGTVVVFSARSYRNGTSETKVQQEAQFAADRIGGIIQNAVKVHANPSDADSALTGEFIIDNNVINYNAETKELTYSEGGGSQNQLLAENIERFWVDDSQFSESKTVGLEMTVSDGIKSYSFAYTMNSRNDDVGNDEETSPIESSSIIVDNAIVMVPGETYKIPVKVRGTAGQLTASCSDYPDAVTALSDGVNMVLPLNAGSDGKKSTTVRIDLIDLKSSSTIRATASVTVLIRRVNKVDVKISSKTEGGNKYYTFRANVTEGLNLARTMGDSDKNWVNPYQMDWTVKLYQDYDEAEDKGTDISSQMKNYFVNPDNDEQATGKITNSKETSTIMFKQVKPLEKGMSLVVTALSLHANGTNKAGLDYDAKDEVKGTAVLHGTGFNEDKMEDILEPGEEREYTVTGLGTGEWRCVVKNEDKLAAGTSITLEDNKKLKVKIGDEETGYTTDEEVLGEKKGNIIVEIKPKDSEQVAAKVGIGIRRITGISIQDILIYDPDPKKGHTVSEPLKKGADHQFATTIKGTHLNLQKTDIDNEVEVLDKYSDNSNAKEITDLLDKEDKGKYEASREILAKKRHGDQPFEVEFTWKLYKNGKEQKKYTGTQIWDVYRENADDINGTVKYKNSKKDAECFELVDLGANNLSYGSASSPNHPCINFSLTKNLTEDYRIEVTAKALYPYRTKTGTAYGDDDIHIATVSLGGKGGNVVDPDDPYYDLDGSFIDLYRGQDYAFVLHDEQGEPQRDQWGNAVSDKIEINNYETSDNRYKAACGERTGKYLWRKREILTSDENGNATYGDYDKFSVTKEGGSSKKLNASETYTLLPNTRYEIDMAYMVIEQTSGISFKDYNGNVYTPKYKEKDGKVYIPKADERDGTEKEFIGVLYWPYSSELAELEEFKYYYKPWWDYEKKCIKQYETDEYGEYIKDASGNNIPLYEKDKDGNYILKDWNDPNSKIPYQEVERSFYSSQSNLGRTYVTFNNGQDTYGTLENPHTLNKNAEFTFALDQTGDALMTGHYQGSIKLRVQELTGDTWELVESSDSTWTSSQAGITPHIIFKKAGTFRISFYISDDGKTWKQIVQKNHDVFNPSYENVSLPSGMALFSGANGTKGYAYVQVNG